MVVVSCFLHWHVCCYKHKEDYYYAEQGLSSFFCHRMFIAGPRGSKVRALFCGMCDSSLNYIKRTEITARVKRYITMVRRTGERCTTNRFAPGRKLRPGAKWLDAEVLQNILCAVYKVIAAHCYIFHYIISEAICGFHLEMLQSKWGSLLRKPLFNLHLE